MARRPAPVGVDRRQRILEAALGVFADEGFEGATTKEIAARADVTQGLIYFYFPSKEDLYSAACALEVKQILERLELPTGDDETPPEVVFRRAVTQLIEALDSPRSARVVRIMMRNAAHSEVRERPGTPLDEARCQIREQAQRIGALFSTYLEAQMARGTIRQVNATLATQLLVSGVMLTVMRRASGDETLGRVSQQELIDTVVGMFLHGLQARSAVAVSAPQEVAG